jgi:Protein of unknown function (DUF3995)
VVVSEPRPGSALGSGVAPGVLAGAAAALGVAYAAVSAYWALGGQALLSTLGQPFERWGHSGTTAASVALWAVVVVKVAAAALPAVSLRWAPGRGWRRWARTLAWTAGCILIAYGLVVSAGDWLSESGAIGAAGAKDHRALVWHAFCWDPWFLLWGALATGALLYERRPSVRFPVAQNHHVAPGRRPSDPSSTGRGHRGRYTSLRCSSQSTCTICAASSMR